jgi:3-hydroxyisobutyrate dehydrogenase-like beta-hydroxyacid dehydrogenase
MTETIGFVGLGKLGRPIAGNLLQAGYPLRVHNRTASKAEELVTRGAQLASTPADAVTSGGIVISLLWDDASVESIMTDDFLSRLGRGGVHVSMSTLSPEASRRIATLHAKHGSLFVEAPVFGRPEAAVARKLFIVYAGLPAAKERVKPLFEAMGAQKSFDFGEAIGAATTVKLVGNMLIISAAASLTETLTLARNSGVDPHAVVDMLTTTLLSAPIYQTYGRMIADGTADLASSPIPTKDLGLFKETARALSSPAPISTFLLDLRSKPGSDRNVDPVSPMPSAP